jgi:dipeptidyl aminopeptidase/acylaminoacyl peptidase
MNTARRRLFLRCTLSAAVVLLQARGGILYAQGPRPMSAVDLLNLSQLGDPQISPDGRDVVFTRAVADWKSGRRVTHIWRARVGAGEPVQLTFGTDGESSPRWSPDGKTIAFVAKRADSEFAQIQLLPADGGEARPLSSHATAVSDIAWAPDGTSIFFRASEPKTAEERAKDSARDDVFQYDETFKHTHVWKIGVANRNETRVTGGDFSVTDYEVSPDGRKLVLQQAPSPLLGDGFRADIWLANTDGSGAVQITKNGVPEGDASLSPDNSQVLFTSGSNAQFESYYNDRLFVVPGAGGVARVLVGEREPIAVDTATWSHDGKMIYFLANLGVHEELFAVAASGGTPKPLTNGRHNITALTQSGPRLAFILSDATSADIYAMSAGDSAPTRVTHFSDELTRTFALGRQEGITWKGADGATVEGILTYPVGYQAGQRYPLVVMTHGGPQASDKFGLGSPGYEIQVFAGRGWAVLQPNYRGSTGYGDPFLRDMIGHYFQNAHLDVVAGVDEVIRRGVADPDRLAKMGWSGGGHMTNKIITFTNRFKAASSGAGAAQWISMYAQSDLRFQRTPWFGGTPWQKNAPIDVYWNQSPLKDVANVATPTIFFVGEQDPRVPMPQSVEMYRALKSNGVPTHLYVAPREPHVWVELRHNLFKMNAEIEWLEKYVTGRAYTWEEAPGQNKSGVKPTTNQQ